MVVVKRDTQVASTALCSLITSHVPSAMMTSEAGSEVSFRLPFESSSAFPALFSYLDDHQEELGIATYGISVTTLEEVRNCGKSIIQRSSR